MVNVVKRLPIHIVYDDLDLVFWDLSFLDVVEDVLSGLVWRSVVNVDHVVVLVVLHEDRVEVSQVETRLDVVVGGNDQAKPQLSLFVLVQLVERLVIKLFVLDDFPDGPLLFLGALVEGREFDLDLAVEGDVVDELGADDGPHVLLERDLEDSLASSVHFVQFGVEDHLANGH